MSARTDAGADDVVGQLSEQFTRAFRRMRAGVARELAPLGVTFAQSRVLRILGRAETSLRVGDIADKLEIVPRSATGVIDALEGAGLCARLPDPIDRRSVLVQLTPKGRDLHERMAKARRSSAEELFGRLSGEEQSRLLEILDAINADYSSGRHAEGQAR